jgi:hypothetical protein
MSKTKTPELLGQSPTQPNESDRAAELRMLAVKIDELVASTGIAALDAVLALATSDDPTAKDKARGLADDLAERSSRLEQDIGRTLLSARIN